MGVPSANPAGTRSAHPINAPEEALTGGLMAGPEESLTAGLGAGVERGLRVSLTAGLKIYPSADPSAGPD
jgi:hypothetical protein